MIKWCVVLLVFCSCVVWSKVASDEAQLRLWYRRPAPVQTVDLPWAPGSGKSSDASSDNSVWESQTLPVGDGRVGGTVYGGVELDCITLNEVSLWSGGANLPHNGGGYQYGPLAGKDSFGSYQPFADLYVQIEGLSGQIDRYVRELDLEEGIVKSSFVDAKAGLVQRECFVVNGLLIYSVRTQNPVNVRVALMPYHTVDYTKPQENTLTLKGGLANGEQFVGSARVVASRGVVQSVGSEKQLEVGYSGRGAAMRPVYDAQGIPYITISGAREFYVAVALATDYKMSAEDHWKDASFASRSGKLIPGDTPLSELRKLYVKGYQKLFRRMTLRLDNGDKQSYANAKLPTDERLASYRKSQNDPALEALVYQYGRYLLISGSRPGNLPLNLQGIWNAKVHAPWACDYHNNINLQMCYWGAEVANLSECHEPLIDYIQAMQKPLAEMTRREYGDSVRGWTSRISQNPWGAGGWVKWNPPVNAWYALHIWDHYLFTQDETYLREKAYPMLKEICHFWEDRLKELGAGAEGLMSNGSPVDVQRYPELRSIPKGALVCPGGWSHEWGPVEDGCMHDQQLVWELFDITAAAAAKLGVDEQWAASLIEKRDRLVPNRISPQGYLQEWIIDRPNMVAGHRHTSHLIGVYPGSSISTARTPELAKAAMKSLELRGLSGDNRRSWTWPWRTALWARFHESEHAYDMVQNYLLYNVLDNLFANHPPMQMDGAYGMTGAMSEMLVQSHAGHIELLPALPKAWSNGRVSGIRARGGITIDMQWSRGRIKSFEIYSDAQNPQPIEVRVQGRSRTLTPKRIADRPTPRK